MKSAKLRAARALSGAMSTDHNQVRRTVLDRHAEEAASPFTREDILAARLRVAKVVPFQRSAPPFISNLSLAICSGLLLVFCFPEWNLWSLAWVGAAPLIMSVTRDPRFWRSLALGTVTGTVFYLGTSHWTTYSMHNYGGLPILLCYLVAVLIAILLGSFTGLFAGVLGLSIRRFGGWAILIAPIIWPAAEWLRLKITGMGWNALGYSQAFEPVIIQTARIGGVYAISALLVVASAALVFGVIYLERRRGLAAIGAAIIIIGATVLYGRPARTVPADHTNGISVAVIQPNVPISSEWDDPRFVDKTISRYLELSSQALDGLNGGLVVWPEAQLNIQYDSDLMLQERLGDFTRKNRVHLLINSWGYPDSGGPRNSAMMIGPSGTKTSQYDKIALMPFGEYVPARAVIPFMDRIPALAGDVEPGSSVIVTEVDGVRIGTIICFEATRPEIARRMREAGATVLVLISNEAWFGPTAAAPQMLAHTIFRAVENNLELVRATNSGLSCYIDSYGRIYGLTGSFETATRRWPVGSVTNGNSTFYARYGDVFALTCTALSAAAALISLVWRRVD